MPMSPAVYLCLALFPASIVLREAIMTVRDKAIAVVCLAVGMGLCLFEKLWQDFKEGLAGVGKYR